MGNLKLSNEYLRYVIRSVYNDYLPESCQPVV